MVCSLRSELRGVPVTDAVVGFLALPEGLVRQDAALAFVAHDPLLVVRSLFFLLSSLEKKLRGFPS